MPEVYVAPKLPPSRAKITPPEPIQTKKEQGVPWWTEVINRVLKEAGEESRKAVLGAYCVFPAGAKFINQQQDEEIVLLLRAHPLTNLGWILITLVMLVLPSILLSTGVFAAVPGKFLFVGRLVWYLMTVSYAFEKFLDWYYSVFIVTNERLVDIDFNNLLWREVTYLNLNHIEEPEMSVLGFFESTFQFGNVIVTSASKVPTVEAMQVPFPDKVVDIISRLSEELEKRRERGE